MKVQSPAGYLPARKSYHRRQRIRLTGRNWQRRTKSFVSMVGRITQICRSDWRAEPPHADPGPFSWKQIKKARTLLARAKPAVQTAGWTASDPPRKGPRS